jgi:hypothetical protein
MPGDGIDDPAGQDGPEEGPEMALVDLSWAFTRTGTEEYPDPRDGVAAANTPATRPMLLLGCARPEGKPDPLGTGADSYRYMGFMSGHEWAFKSGAGSSGVVYKRTPGGSWAAAFNMLAAGVTNMTYAYTAPNGVIYVYDSEPRLHRIADPLGTPTATTVIYEDSDSGSPKFTRIEAGETGDIDALANEGRLVDRWSLDWTLDGQRMAVVEYNAVTTETASGWRIFWSTDGGASFGVLLDAGDAAQRARLGLVSWWKHLHLVRYLPALDIWCAWAGDAAQACSFWWRNIDNPTVYVGSPLSATCVQPVDAKPWANGVAYADDTLSHIAYFDCRTEIANSARVAPLWQGWFPASGAAFAWALGRTNGLIAAMSNNDASIATATGRQIYRDATFIALQDAVDGRYNPPAAIMGRLRCNTSGLGAFHHWPFDGGHLWGQSTQKDEDSGDNDYNAEDYGGRSWIEQEHPDWMVRNGTVIDAGANLVRDGVSAGSISLSSPWAQASGAGITGDDCLSVTIPSQESTSYVQTVRGITTATFDAGDEGVLTIWARADKAISAKLGCGNNPGGSVVLGGSIDIAIGTNWRRYRIPFTQQGSTTTLSLWFQLINGTAVGGVPSQTWDGGNAVYFDRLCVRADAAGGFGGTEAATKGTPEFTALFSAPADGQWTDVFEVAPDFSSHKAMDFEPVIRKYTNAGGDTLELLYRREDVDVTVTSATAAGNATSVSVSSGLTPDMVGSLIYFVSGSNYVPCTISAVASGVSCTVQSNRANGLTGTFRVIKSVWVLKATISATTYYAYCPAREVFHDTAGYKFAIQNGLAGIQAWHWSGDGWRSFIWDTFVQSSAEPAFANQTCGIFAGSDTAADIGTHVTWNWGWYDEQLDAAGLTAAIAARIAALTATPDRPGPAKLLGNAAVSTGGTLPLIN